MPNYNGKHVVQNHPNVANKGKATIVLAGIILASSLSAHALTKQDKEININNKAFSKQYESTIALPEVSTIIEHIKAQYRLEDEYGLTFEGLIFDYFNKTLLNISEEKQLDVISQILQDKDLINKIYNYAINNSNIPITLFKNVENQNVTENIKIIKSNEQLMKYIRTYANTYGEDQNKIIALIAYNMNNGNINNNNPLGINNDWFTLGAKYSVYNYDLNTNQDLRNFKNNSKRSLEEAILYGIMVTQSSIKQANGNGLDSFAYIKYGPHITKLTDEQKNDIENYKNEILSYIVKSSSMSSPVFITNYTLSENNTRQTMERIQSEEYTFNIINRIITELKVSLSNTYGKSLN